jgi:outer membrane protein TolC
MHPLLFALLLQSDRWTVDRMVEESLRLHPQMASAQAALVSSQQQLLEAQRAWWPSFSVDNPINAAPDVRCLPSLRTDQVGTAETVTCSRSTVHNLSQTGPDGITFRWDLRMGWLIYGLGPLRNVADEGLKISEARLEATRLDLAVAIRRTYWSVQLFRALRGMVTGARVRLEEAISKIKGKPTDRLRLDVQVSNVDTRIEDANKGERIAMASLRVLVPGDNLSVEGELKPVELADHPLSYYVDAARTHRPESQMLLHGTRAAGFYRDFLRLQLLPQVVLLGGVAGLVKTTTADDTGLPYLNHPFADHGYAGGLLVHWDLDFQNKLPRLRRSWEDWQAARAGAGAAEAGIALEVMQAYETLAETRERMQILAKGDQAAQRWLAIAQERYEKKKGDAREFTDALLGWFDSHGNYLQAIFDYDSAVAQISRTTGLEMFGGKP